MLLLEYGGHSTREELVRDTEWICDVAAVAAAWLDEKRTQAAAAAEVLGLQDHCGTQAQVQASCCARS